MASPNKQSPSNNGRNTLSTGISIILLFPALICLLLGFSSGKAICYFPGLILLIVAISIMTKKEPNRPVPTANRLIKVPSNIYNYKIKTYSEIEASFRNAGFTKIYCIPLGDLTFGWLEKPNYVESISISNKDISSCLDEYPPDAKVVIAYHSFDNSIEV